MIYDTYPYYTQDGINKGLDYKCASNEYGLLDYKNKRFIIKTIPKLDDTIIKKTIITFKPNTLGAVVTKDISIGKTFVDNCSKTSDVFIGTEKELADYADKLIKKGYNIQDFYNYE